MSAYFQPGSISADLVVHREIEERIRRARSQEMVRMAADRPVRRIALLGPRPARLLSAVGTALRMPVAGSARRALDG